MKQFFCVLVAVLLSVMNLSAQAPTATFEVSDNSVCAGECILIENTSQNSATSWVWSFGTGLLQIRILVQNLVRFVFLPLVLTL
jgi:hypothetical protein